MGLQACLIFYTNKTGDVSYLKFFDSLSCEFL